MPKYIDTPSIVQVIGAIYNDPSILDNEKYTFYEEDFPEEFHKIIFGSIYNLHALGAKDINTTTIEDYLASRPEKYAIYKTNQGAEYLQKINQFLHPVAFDYYYNRMKKMTLFRAYQNIGIDLTWLYNPDDILNVKKVETQENWLDSTSIEEIADLIDKKIFEVRTKYADNEQDSLENAGSGAIELLARLKETPDVGVPLYGPLINTVCRGARLKKLYLRSAATGLGKAIPNDTIIPTPNGYKRVDEIQEGDFLFGQDGFPTKVLKIYPQKEPKEIWKVTFSDGRIAECCKDHLWEYSYETHSGRKTRVESIEQIYQRSLKLKNGLKDSNNKGYRFRIPLNEPVFYDEKEFSISPYALGLLLGDGSFRYNKTNKALSFSSQDDELPSYLAQELGNCIFYRDKANYDYHFKPLDNPQHNLWVEEILQNYPELWQTKSETKFIPKEYLMGSYTQRLDLLQGLLDTDGHIDYKGRITYTTISPYLRDDIIELCHGLGMQVNYLIDQRSEKYTTGECYILCIQCKKQLKPRLFKLKRKHQIAEQYANNKKRNEYEDYLAIVKIEPTNKKTDMTCFTVNNESHLFLMNDYIVTHNTRSMIADSCYIACDELYNSETQQWEKNGVQEPTMFITTEQEKEEIQTMMIAFLSDVDEEKIINGEYDFDEWDRVCHAAHILSQSPLYIQELPDFSLKDIESVIKIGIKEHNIQYICYDYLHSSMKILNEVGSRSGVKNLREDNILFMIAVKLKDICNQYGVFIITATQLNGEYRTANHYDQNLLRGAKSIADRIDTGMIMLETSQEDIVALESLLQQGGFATPQVKIAIYKNRRGRYKDILLWCSANRGTCKIKPMFATNYNYELIEIEDLKIQVQ